MIFRTLIASVFIMAGSAASAAVVDTFDLDTTTAAGTDSNVLLSVGQTYLITVSGRFTLGSNPIRHVADAEYFNIGGTPPDPLDGTSIDIGVGIDGVDIDFGSFDPSSVYTASIIGDGTTINVFYADTAYGDNQGSLAISIATVPLPAGALLLLTALGGLVMGASRRRTI